MQMNMDHIQEDGKKLSPAEVIGKGHMMSPTEMTMKMQSGMGNALKPDSSGLGDTSISALHKLLNNHGNKAHFSLALSTPKGSIDEKMKHEYSAAST